MRRIVSLTAAWCGVITVASAEPIDLHCKTEGLINKLYGTLSIHVDEANRYVRISAPERLPDALIEYRDGSFARVFTGKMYPWMTDETFQQFVIVTPSTVEVGWRDEDGEIVHLGWFYRAALRKNGPPCRWHNAREFALT